MRVVLLDFATDEKGLRTLELARLLGAQPGVTPLLACPRKGQARMAAAGAAEVRVVPFRGGYGHFLWLFTLWGELRKPDTVLLAHGLQAAQAALWCARLWNVPVVYMARGLWPLSALSLTRRRQVRLVCGRAERVITPTAELGEAFVGHGCAAEKIRLCPWGMAAGEAGMSRGERLVFLAADSLIPQSGLSDLVDAMALVQGMEGLPLWEVRILGEGPDFAELLDKARTLGVEGRLALLGPQVLRDQLALAHVAVSAGRESRGQDAFVLAAWAAGRALVATGTPELRDLLVDKENALVAPPGNAVVLAAAMVRCLQEPDLLERLEQGGRETLAGFSPEVWAGRVLAVCEEARQAGAGGKAAKQPEVAAPEKPVE